MVMSSPFRAESTPLWVAAQSDRMYPWKPSSCFNQPFWARAFWNPQTKVKSISLRVVTAYWSFSVAPYLASITAVDEV